MIGANGFHVAIDAASVHPSRTGGVATALMALVRALGRLEDGEESYTIVVHSEEQVSWLGDALGPNQRIRARPVPTADPATFAGRLKRALGPLLPAARRAQALVNLPRQWPEVPVSDGFYEGLGCDLVHFSTQRFVLCALPAVYNPHDLQHLHYPQFWSPGDIAWRETVYPAGCRFARTVVVGSEWTKQDVVRQYSVPPDKVQVIPEGPPTMEGVEPTSDALLDVKARYRLEDDFALYPAATWPHKNHLRLLEALASLRDRGQQRIPLVCTGPRPADSWPRVERAVSDLGLESQVRFLGFVPEDDLRVLHRLARFLVLPTLFEASSLPIFEAWREGLPVACANVTALPDQAMDAALLFDPMDTGAIAQAMLRLSGDAALRGELRQRGYERLQDFDWDRTARCYRAVYRRAGGRPLNEEDRCLLEWDWMREPRRAKEILR
jgi:glycosyltransferase involved in cell wall biosynthesis